MELSFDALQPVLVVWRDAASLSDTWFDLEEIEPTQKMILTTGFLVPNTGDHVVVLQSYSADGDGDSGISIPSELVFEIRPLGTPIKGAKLCTKWAT